MFATCVIPRARIRARGAPLHLYRTHISSATKSTQICVPGPHEAHEARIREYARNVPERLLATASGLSLRSNTGRHNVSDLSEHRIIIKKLCRAGLSPPPPPSTDGWRLAPNGQRPTAMCRPARRHRCRDRYVVRETHVHTSPPPNDLNLVRTPHTPSETLAQTIRRSDIIYSLVRLCAHIFRSDVRVRVCVWRNRLLTQTDTHICTAVSGRPAGASHILYTSAPFPPPPPPLPCRTDTKQNKS